MDRQAIGKEAERNAETWLTAQGLHLIQRNLRCRLGEIDLIMTDGQHLVLLKSGTESTVFTAVPPFQLTGANSVNYFRLHVSFWPEILAGPSIPVALTSLHLRAITNLCGIVTPFRTEAIKLEPYHGT